MSAQQGPPSTLFLPAPGMRFDVGAKWTPRRGRGDFSDCYADADLWWIWRGPRLPCGCLYWGMEDWERPDLGRNRQGNPYILSPDGVILYKGDDRRGDESDLQDTRFDEEAHFDLRKVRRGYTQYMHFLAYSPPDMDDPDLPPYRPDNDEDPRNWDITACPDLQLIIRDSNGHDVLSVSLDTEVDGVRLMRPGIHSIYAGSFDLSRKGWMINARHQQATPDTMFNVAASYEGISFQPAR